MDAEPTTEPSPEAPVDPAANAAMARAWRATRRAGLWNAIVGGLATLLVMLVAVAMVVEMTQYPRAFDGEAVAVIGLVSAFGLSFGGQLAVGCYLQGRSERARRAVLRRLVWLGAAGVVPLLAGGLFLIATIISAVMFMTMGGMGGMPGMGGGGFWLLIVLSSVLPACIAGVVILVSAWPWFVLIRYRGWLQHLAAS